MKKLQQIGIWIALLAYLVIALAFASEKRSGNICSKIQVHINDSLEDKFVSEKYIAHFIHDLDQKVLGQPIKKVNIKKLEETITNKPIIKNTEVYFTGTGILHIEIDQRNPIVRVINHKGQNYYLDREGAIITLSSYYASHVLVASGSIYEFFEIPRTNWLKCPDKMDTQRNNSICEIFSMAKFINSDPFWKSQIEQIYLTKEGEYELIPRVGAHLIKLGPYENFREKMRNLRVFYKKGLNNVGWNQYLVINLKYDNQIICKKQ